MAAASYVFPVRYVSGGVAVQTTSCELSPMGIAVRSLSPPRVGARVSMALYLPRVDIPAVAIGRVSRSRSGTPADAGFWADFIVVDPQARMNISTLLADHEEKAGQHRICQRVPVRLQVRFRAESEFVQEELAVNLSRGGMFIRRIFLREDEPPALGASVEVEIHLADGRPPVTSAGIVVRRQLPAPGKISGVAVQFVDASDSFRERIDRYMDSLLPH